jgi:uroporphyrinogen III methyltransferase/synthase
MHPARGGVPGLGTVYLVGAGPGDPGLLTLRGAQLLARADVVVHDRLTDSSLLSLAKPGALQVDVGKQPDARGNQDEINDLLIGHARAGRNVVRLKGGDPFVFGRGGEEALALQGAGIPFEVVPGVTSATGAPAYAGVPVTHRGLATSFTVVAGHSRSLDGAKGTNWEALAAVGGTIVVLMGVAHRAEIAARLMAGGLAAGTPVAAVQWGARPEQVTVRTTLAELGKAPLAPPATIVVGQVASLDLAWYERRPLFGATVVVTRAAHQAPALSERLSALGARVLELPSVMLSDPADGGNALAAAVGRLAAGAYAWVVFTSANAVERLFRLVPDTRALGDVKVAAVGPATRDALSSYRVVADLVPAQHLAEGILERFPSARTTGDSAGGSTGAAVARCLLLPQAGGARPELRQGLAALGWQVDAVEAYRTVPQPIQPDQLRLAARADAICFASSSAVTSYLDQAAAVLGEQSAQRLVPPIVACIGPVTASTARSRGLDVTAEASEHTIDGLVSALASALSRS